MYYIKLSILNLPMKITPCIVGLGYVGLPIALALSKKFFTYGFYINNERIKNLKKKIDINNEFNNEEFNFHGFSSSGFLDMYMEHVWSFYNQIYSIVL